MSVENFRDFLRASIQYCISRDKKLSRINGDMLIRYFGGSSGGDRTGGRKIAIDLKQASGRRSTNGALPGVQGEYLGALRAQAKMEARDDGGVPRISEAYNAISSVDIIILCSSGVWRFVFIFFNAKNFVQFVSSIAVAEFLFNSDGLAVLEIDIRDLTSSLIIFGWDGFNDHGENFQIRIDTCQEIER